jgi:preprotein translocase YajC subunit
MLPLLVLLGTIAGAWYLLIVRPQKDQQSRHGRLVERLQVGDHVLTVGGIYGRVIAVEQSTVVLELAPGLKSRIATDGIARIVHAGEAALPAPTNATAPRQALEDDMHQHPDQHPPMPPQPAQPAPQQYFPAAQLPAQPYAVAPQQQPQPVAPAPPSTTLRAQVVQPRPLPTFEPRPWGDAAPVAHAAPQHAPAPVAWQPNLPAPPQLAAPAAPQPATMHQPVAAPMPLHQPFAGQPQPQQPVAMPVMPMPVHVQAPVAYQQPPVAYQQAPVAYHAPVVACQQQPMAAMTAPMPVAVPEAPVEDGGRRHSRAPKGMGSSLRLDDPTLRDTIDRARTERAGLAEEYRKLTAPLVQVDQPVAQVTQQHAVQQPVLVGHDPNGVPLFATPGVAGVHPIAHFPAPAHVPDAHAHVPRPMVQAPHGVQDPAFGSASAFQRPTPYAPAAPAQPAPPAQPGAYAHA